jgi:predicted PurR-regulated permease PerM
MAEAGEAGRERIAARVDVPEAAAELRRMPERLAPALGGRLFAAVGLLLLGALFLRFFEEITHVLLIAFVGILLALAFHAVVRRIPLPRAVATALVALATVVLLGVGAWQGTRVLLPEVRSLAGDLPGIQARLEAWQSELQAATGMELDLVGGPTEALVENPVGAATSLVAGAFGVLEILGIALLVLFGAFFVVGKPNEQLLEPLMRAVPRARRDAMQRMLDRMSVRLLGWLRGTLLSMAIIGALSGLAFWLAGAPYPALLGVWVGLVEIIPVVGPWIGGATAVLVTLVHSPSAALYVAIAVLVIQQVEGNLVRPFVMSGAAELHPFVTLIALLLFAAVFGFLGALLALPLTLALATAIEVWWVEERLDAGDDRIEPVVET